MAITKMMHMKASGKAKIDIHLEHAINYILQPKKLGKENLVGGINCLPDMAYEQMKSTKQMFGKTGGRQGYHFVISLKPGEGTPEIIYDIGMRFANEAFNGEYEGVVAVHTDKDHIHAHIIINSVNMVSGYKFQYKNGDWKSYFQPITNRLCEEYGLNITPAEYSKEPTNVTRPQWERQQAFAELIKQDALYCANNAESMEHFIFLLEKLGFEVKQGKHIAVKAPGMKKFKRLDTISEEFSREKLEQMFKTDFVRNRMTTSRTEKFMPVRNAILTPYQRKCYVRMYRVHLADKKKFTYRPAHLYEQIRKMHELQEEYLLMVDYNVHSYMDLIRLRDRVKDVNDELCGVQKEMYRERAMQKRACKSYEEMVLFEEKGTEYREKLEQIKLLKKENLKKLKVIERCIERDGSALETELEKRMPVGEFEDINNIVADKVLEKSYVESKLKPTKDEYMSMSVAERVRCYTFDKMGTGNVFDMVKEYFETVGISTDFDSVYEEARLLMDYYEKHNMEENIEKKVEQIIGIIEVMEMDGTGLKEYPADVLGEVFDVRDMEYFTGIKVFNKVMDRLGIRMEKEERYEIFDRIYEEGVRGKKREKNRGR